MATIPFEDSRRLTGPNPYFQSCGAALETASGEVAVAQIAAWQSHVISACQFLGWPEPELFSKPHRSGVSLAFSAPFDVLLCATEVNEWAWALACNHSLGEAPAHPAVWDETLAFKTLEALAKDERVPGVLALIEASKAHGVPALVDEEMVTLGSGVGGQDFPLTALPDPDELAWSSLFAVPTAVVTGSNGKTTTVRLIAAMQAAAGRCVGFNCTDGLFINGEKLDTGDYSGPIGARTVLRHKAVEAAILETARGGLLRRGLAVQRADAAIVTNISADHFGEYGVHDLNDLAAVKLAVARVIDERGLLVLNADNALLRSASNSLTAPLGWFSLMPTSEEVRPLIAERPACVMQDGALWLYPRGLMQAGESLGSVMDMPLSLQSRARYNIENLAGAALMAHALGISTSVIAQVLARFGQDNADNRGRLEHWTINGIEVWLDYAHNPEGLAGLLEVTAPASRPGRLGLLLGHAGNRLDADLRAVAEVAAAARPDRVVLKDIDGYERGRASGSVAEVMSSALIAAGVMEENVGFIASEVAAAKTLFAWAKAGDSIVLPVHGYQAKAEIIAWLEEMAVLNSI